MFLSGRELLFVLSVSPVIASLSSIHLPFFGGNSSNGTCAGLPQQALVKFASNDIVTDIYNFGAGIVNKTFVCESASKSEAERLIKKIKVYLCNGCTIAECVSEPLENVCNLPSNKLYNPANELVIFIHGWRQSAVIKDYSDLLISAYCNKTYNFVIVDWSAISDMWYPNCVALMPRVAEALARALDACEFTNFTIVGHSLGAHLAGMTTRNMSKRTEIQIYGLDPAGPLFSFPQITKCLQGLETTDAPFVATVHTDMGRNGICELLGHVTYFINGGTALQPGCAPYDVNPKSCTPLLCSHMAVIRLWSIAMLNRGSVMARQCYSHSGFKSGACNGNPSNDITKNTSIFGTYFYDSPETLGA